jgi:hypothetical protein
MTEELLIIMPCLYDFIVICMLMKDIIFCLVRLNSAGKYMAEEDEISMGRVSAIATPQYAEREAMREYYR